MHRLFGLLALGALLVACQSAPPAAGSKPPAAASPAAAQPAAPAASPTAPLREETVRTAIPKTLSDAGVSIGLARGYFQEQAIVFDDVFIPTGAEMVSSLATGQIEAALGAPSAGLFNAIGRGALIKLVGDKGSAPPGFGYTAFVVRKDLWDSGELREPADLRGRTIALSGAGVTSEIYLGQLLERGGLSLSDANVTAMAFRDMQTALANGSIDVANAIEPGVTQLVDLGVGVRWIGTDEIEPDAQVSTLMYSVDFAEKRRDAADRFMVAYVRGLRDYNDAFRKGQGKEDVIQILMEWTGLKERSLYDRMAPAGLHVDGCVNPTSLRLAYDWWLGHGQILAPVDLDRVVDLSFCRHAASVDSTV
jgi:NitT/TauT family transport system substrate-binding protein